MGGRGSRGEPDRADYDAAISEVLDRIVPAEPRLDDPSLAAEVLL